ncbi:ABC transporter permease [Niabella beijingensis]|uniref:ABC transporter permease n=1 Tax=Niabella beijingensis TaxID=2872700 RepID=UPI001CBAC4FF|nr:ABC transporter permease [Niabella beijingensis]MBZ4192178.1 ABC transporter permease [Niabella beijingensis]
MIKNYLKTAWRSLWKNKSFSLLNILGLSVGIAATGLLFLWVQKELSIDREYTYADRLYQVYNRDLNQGAPYTFSSTPNPMGPVLKTDYPEIEDVTRTSENSFFIANGERRFKTDGMFVDEGFISMFGFPVIAGDKSGNLKTPGDIFITESFARKLYGSEDAMGRMLTLNDTNVLKVAAVLKDPLPTTRFQFEFLLPWAAYDKLFGPYTSWTGNNVKTYILLKKQADPDVVADKIKHITAAHTAQDNSTRNLTQFLHPARLWHLYSKSENGQLTDGAISKVRIFMAVGILMVVIACINFVNLTTARTERKAREVGVRKVAGARRYGLILQFISESLLLSLLSGIIAILLLLLLLPSFNRLFDTALELDVSSGGIWIFFTAIILLSGVGAGLYPAFYLSSFAPARVLKGRLTIARGKISLRKVLVVTQFSFAIALIICTLIIKKQMNYAQQREMGYNKDQLLFSPVEGMAIKNYQMIRQELLQSGAVVSVTGSQNPVTGFSPRYFGFHWEGSTENDESTSFHLFNADGSFTQTFGTRIIAGRDIDVQRFPTDSTAVLLNEEAVKLLHLKDPVGKKIGRTDDLHLHIVGVVKNYISGSPYSRIEPVMILGPNPDFGISTLHYKLNPARPVPSTIAQIGSIFKKYNPGYPFEYTFADQDYAKKFASEQNLSSLIGLFSALSIFIACLGLLGLAAYMAETRYKEIGIRKVLGASVSGILLLLARDFVKPVFIAALIASPVAWWIMTRWLQGYDYRTAIGWTAFAIAGGLVFLIAVVTIISQTLKAAVSNPSKALRSE